MGRCFHFSGTIYNCEILNHSKRWQIQTLCLISKVRIIDRHDKISCTKKLLSSKLYANWSGSGKQIMRRFVICLREQLEKCEIARRDTLKTLLRFRKKTMQPSPCWEGLCSRPIQQNCKKWKLMLYKINSTKCHCSKCYKLTTRAWALPRKANTVPFKCLSTW